MIINIYYTKDQNKKLEDLQRKYQVSKSTIAEKILFYLTKYLMQEAKKDIIQNIGENYLYDGKGSKTSIKPKLDPLNNGYYKNLTKAYTNCLQIYLHKDVKKYLDNVEAFYNDLNSELQKTNEPNWDYNHFIRSIKRYERKLQQCK